MMAIWCCQNSQTAQDQLPPLMVPIYLVRTVSTKDGQPDASPTLSTQSFSAPSSTRLLRLERFPQFDPGQSPSLQQIHSRLPGPELPMYVV